MLWQTRLKLMHRMRISKFKKVDPESYDIPNLGYVDTNWVTCSKLVIAEDSSWLIYPDDYGVVLRFYQRPKLPAGTVVYMPYDYEAFIVGNLEERIELGEYPLLVSNSDKDCHRRLLLVNIHDVSVLEAYPAWTLLPGWNPDDHNANAALSMYLVRVPMDATPNLTDISGLYWIRHAVPLKCGASFLGDDKVMVIQTDEFSTYLPRAEFHSFYDLDVRFNESLQSIEYTHFGGVRLPAPWVMELGPDIFDKDGWLPTYVDGRWLVNKGRDASFSIYVASGFNIHGLKRNIFDAVPVLQEIARRYNGRVYCVCSPESNFNVVYKDYLQWYVQVAALLAHVKINGRMYWLLPLPSALHGLVRIWMSDIWNEGIKQ